MREALAQANTAFNVGEVPIGAVIVDSLGNVLSEGHNQNISTSDPTEHAEIVAIRKLVAQKKDRYLEDTTIYVTVEPCLMCAGAIINARIPRVVFGAWEPKTGASGSVYDVLRDSRLPHPQIEVVGGVLETEAAELMEKFFAQKRL